MNKLPNYILCMFLLTGIFLLKGTDMAKNKDPVSFLFNNNPGRFKSLEPNEEFLKLEDEVRQRNLIYNPNIQRLMNIAAFGNDSGALWAKQKIQMILESDRIMDMETGDVFRPLAPEQLLSQGDLLLFNQVDGTPWKIPTDTLTRGVLLAGSQGSGKTMLLISICKQLGNAGIPFFILDPKLGLKQWAAYLDATYIDVDDISIDLSPPPGLTYEQFLPAIVPQLGETIGVIFGIELLQEAAQICINQRNEYIKTGRQTEISVKDLYDAIPFVRNTSSGRRSGYKDGLMTGLSRILSGSGNLFSCRKGIDLATLFNSNVILGCRSIVDDFAVKFLGLFLLYWLYESGRYSLPSNKLKRVLVFDDASRFLANSTGFDFSTKTSNFTNIFSCLRSSKNGFITTTQVPHLADPGIVALSHTAICVGALHYEKDTKVITQMMGLNKDQRMAINHLAKRETIGLSAGTAWPKVVHGHTVDVP